MTLEIVCVACTVICLLTTFVTFIFWHLLNKVLDSVHKALIEMRGMDIW